ncbi:hypothetical protein [Paenibacillus periandrae]|uniref:hypothetical protein n=1 Tax=Paenibacillus periandrae TaxID=1761741 RepID=UPI001F08AAE7|nr:hypothetical protein [Paenibacillus periandrae]
MTMVTNHLFMKAYLIAYTIFLGTFTVAVFSPGYSYISEDDYRLFLQISLPFLIIFPLCMIYSVRKWYKDVNYCTERVIESFRKRGLTVKSIFLNDEKRETYRFHVDTNQGKFDCILEIRWLSMKVLSYPELNTKKYWN